MLREVRGAEERRQATRLRLLPRSAAANGRRTGLDARSGWRSSHADVLSRSPRTAVATKGRRQQMTAGHRGGTACNEGQARDLERSLDNAGNCPKSKG